MLRHARPFVLLALLAILAPVAVAAVTTTVVDLPTRPGVTQRILLLRPDAPVANLLFAPGGDGALNIRQDGTMSGTGATCSPIARYRQAYADAGIAVALVDVPSDGYAFNPIDAVAVARYMRSLDAVPTWIAGISSSTAMVVDTALAIPPDVPAGFIAMSPDPTAPSEVNKIARTTLVVYHQQDALAHAGALYAALTSAPAKEIVGLTGGSSAGRCLGYHTFTGLDEELKVTLTGLMAKYAGTVAASPAARAVEFYNQGLDHYFLTHVAAEIAILDAGTTIKGWVRTGESFPVYAAAQAGSSPVCRFYIPPDKGDSHFYGRGTAECDATAAANPSFVNEDSQFFHVVLPVAGICSAGTQPVYRVFSNRADANHRYMVKREIRDRMAARGWVVEGDGADFVVMCAPA